MLGNLGVGICRPWGPARIRFSPVVRRAPGFGALITLALSSLFLLALASGTLLQVIQAMMLLYFLPPLHTHMHRARVCAKSLQSCLTLCDPVDCSPLGPSIHGILQARFLERIAMTSSRGSLLPSRPTERNHISYISRISERILQHCTTREAPFRRVPPA